MSKKSELKIFPSLAVNIFLLPFLRREREKKRKNDEFNRKKLECGVYFEESPVTFLLYALGLKEKSIESSSSQLFTSYSDKERESLCEMEKFYLTSNE